MWYVQGKCQIKSAVLVINSKAWQESLQQMWLMCVHYMKLLIPELCESHREGTTNNNDIHWIAYK